MSDVDVRSQMEPLELLDLSKVNTVGELVAAMAKTSFGGRMLGEVAETFTKMVAEEKKPLVIYDGRKGVALSELLGLMMNQGMVRDVMILESAQKLRKENHVVVGHYSERFEDSLERCDARTLFVNLQGQCKSGLTEDGFYPDVVFSDPRFIMPLLHAVARERLFGERKTVTEFFDGLEKYGGLAKEVVHGAHALRRQFSDPECDRMLTLSGAMTVAQMGLLVCDLIDSGKIDLVSATGALMGHGLVAAMGLKHYKHRPEMTDEVLRDQAINRVTDTYEPEENFDHIEEIVSAALENLVNRVVIAPSDLYREIGRILCERFPSERGILKSCYEHDVPVLTPAFVDSEVGNDVAVFNFKRTRAGLARLIVHPELDTLSLLLVATGATKRGIFSIGGGVPRNNTQNVAPLRDIMNKRAGTNFAPCDFQYGVRIDPTPMHYGNLGGCTYREGMSWGKFDMKDDATPGDYTRRFGEIHADATIVWPFLQKFLFENLSR